MKLSVKELRSLANERMVDLIDKEAVRARARVEELMQRYPTAGPRELSQHLIDSRKSLASIVGGVTGVFGAVTVPLDLAGMLYIQLALLTDVATAFKQPLKSEREKQELIDLLGYTNGVGPLQRSAPRVLGSVAAAVLAKGGMSTLSRAVPVVAAPISAFLNHRHIQKVGDAAVRHFDGWQHAHEKSKKASGA